MLAHYLKKFIDETRNLEKDQIKMLKLLLNNEKPNELLTPKTLFINYSLVAWILLLYWDIDLTGLQAPIPQKKLSAELRQQLLDILRVVDSDTFDSTYLASQICRIVKCESDGFTIWEPEHANNVILYNNLIDYPDISKCDCATLLYEEESDFIANIFFNEKIQYILCGARNNGNYGEFAQCLLPINTFYDIYEKWSMLFDPLIIKIFSSKISITINKNTSLKVDDSAPLTDINLFKKLVAFYRIVIGDQFYLKDMEVITPKEAEQFISENDTRRAEIFYFPRLFNQLSSCLFHDTITDHYDHATKKTEFKNNNQIIKWGIKFRSIPEHHLKDKTNFITFENYTRAEQIVNVVSTEKVINGQYGGMTQVSTTTFSNITSDFFGGTEMKALFFAKNELLKLQTSINNLKETKHEHISENPNFDRAFLETRNYIVSDIVFASVISYEGYKDWTHISDLEQEDMYSLLFDVFWTIEAMIANNIMLWDIHTGNIILKDYGDKAGKIKPGNRLYTFGNKRWVTKNNYMRIVFVDLGLSDLGNTEYKIGKQLFINRMYPKKKQGLENNANAVETRKKCIQMFRQIFKDDGMFQLLHKIVPTKSLIGQFPTEYFSDLDETVINEHYTLLANTDLVDIYDSKGMSDLLSIKLDKKISIKAFPPPKLI